MNTLSYTQEHKKALEEYYRLLETEGLGRYDFRTALVIYINEYPYFFPPYLDMLEHLEVFDREKEYDEFLALTLDTLYAFSGVVEIRHFLSEASPEEVYALLYILKRFDKKKYIVKPKILFLLWSLEKFVKVTYAEVSFKTTGTFLKLHESNIDTQPFIKELERSKSYWYASLHRQVIRYHKHTQTIVLRVLKDRTKDIVPVDGNHESVVTGIGCYFEKTLSFLDEYAKEHNLGLGRVVITRLRPGEMIYQHLDMEEHLQGRDRFHLVLQSKGENVLDVGSDRVRAQEGELWFFSNKVFHRVRNNSKEWRVHLIFEAYPVDAIKRK